MRNLWTTWRKSIRRRCMRRKSFSTIDLMEAIRESLKMVEMILPANVDLVVDLPATPCWVYGDTTQICQVLLNLYANAYQAVGKENGTLTVTVDIRERMQTIQFRGLTLPPEVCILVSDTGSGMTEDVLDRAFDPFFTTKATGSGTGLGLSIVQSIVENHNGVIEVKSKPFEGSQFIITLPCVPLPMNTDTQAVITKPSSGKGISVMMVDDNLSIIKLTRTQLEKRGYMIHTFYNAQAALNALQQHPERCDVLVTDYLMPGLTGLDLAHACRALRPEMPIIMITGLVDAKILSLSRSGMIDAAVVKPLEYDSLCMLMDRLLAQRQGERP